MSRQGMAISLTDLLTLGPRLKEMQRYNEYLGAQTELAKQRGEQEREEYGQKQHQEALAHAAQTVLIGHQYGIHSPEFQAELAKNPIAQQHGIAAYQVLGKDNAWKLPEGTWMAVDAHGNPLYEDQYSHDPDTGLTTINEGTRGQDPRTGRKSNPIDPSRTPVSMVPEQRQALVRFQEAGGKPQNVAGKEDEQGFPQTVEESNVPGVPSRLAPQEAGTRAMAMFYRSQGMAANEAARAAAAANKFPELQALTQFLSRRYPDELSGGKTWNAQGQAIFDSALGILAKTNGAPGLPAQYAKSDPEVRFAMLYQTAVQHAGNQKPQGPPDPFAASGALPGGQPGQPGPAKPAVPQPPPPTGNPALDVKNKAAFDAQQQQTRAASADQRRQDNVYSDMESAFRSAYGNNLKAGQADKLAQENAISQAREQLAGPGGSWGAQDLTSGVVDPEDLAQAEQRLRKKIAAPPQPAQTPAPAPAQQPQPGVLGTTPAPQQVQQQPQPPPTAATGFAKGGLAQAKVGKVMHEWGQGKLHSGSKHGPLVTDQKQAVAIAMKEAGISRGSAGGGYSGSVGVPGAPSRQLHFAKGGAAPKRGFGVLIVVGKHHG
ncbi:MAG: hypothetical protein KGL39_06970 [Patescibacteria group bacterium]|nr:hypothetical protein [Patescibacteria group bacterium]